jgi:tRNA pseudouridine38-40 synthase
MRTFKLTLEYDGAGFCGWQAQGQGERTVQTEVENALLKVFKKPVKVIASGRTDSGVHARGQVVSFKADTRMKPLEIKRALNGLQRFPRAVQCQREDLPLHGPHPALAFGVLKGPRSFLSLSAEFVPRAQGSQASGRPP